MRSLIQALRPEQLESEGFLIALSRQMQSLFVRSSIDLHIDLGTVEPELDIAGKEALYRIGIEAAHNVLKHARATRIDVRLNVSAKHAELSISDNGLGFQVDADHSGHFGLQTMRERAEHNNGSLTVRSSPGFGTTITALLALR
jgi:signal transduction histidine kinase